MGHLISRTLTGHGHDSSVDAPVNMKGDSTSSNQNSGVSLASSTLPSEFDQTSKIHDYPQVLGPANSHNARRHLNGYWVGPDIKKLHDSFTDHEFAKSLPNFFKQEKCSTVIDVGCGNGTYAQAISDQGIFVNCYDGNPETQNISNGRCAILDFSRSLNLLSQYDWVLSLKVGKHIPKEYEETFIQNLHRTNKKGIVITWGGSTTATPASGQDVKYFNQQPDSYIIDKFTKLGYVRDVKSEQVLRNSARDSAFRSRLLVFRKQDKNT